jgi:hypothetical protein
MRVYSPVVSLRGATGRISKCAGAFDNAIETEAGQNMAGFDRRTETITGQAGVRDFYHLNIVTSSCES